VPHRVLTLQEVCDFLHLPENEVRRLAKFEEIPCFRNGDKLVFPKTELDAWASTQLLGSKDKDLERFHKNSSRAKEHDLSEGHAFLHELLHPDCIEAEFHAKTKSSVVRGMAALAENSGYVYDPEELVRSLVEREEMRSTALEMGVALLHPRHHAPYMFEDSFVALAHSFQPIGYGAPDGEQTDLFFLVCCQADNIHLHVLARISMMCIKTNVLAELREAETAREMREMVLRSEEEIIKKL